MCEPTTLAVLQGVSAVAGFVSMMRQANQTDDAAEQNRQISERNAKLKETQAEHAIAKGKREEQDKRRETMIRKGKQQANIGASNLLIDSGTAAQLLEDTEQFGELDALTIRQNAENEANFYQQQADNERFAGGVQFNQTKNKASNQRFNAIGSLATNAGQVASKWYTLKEAA